VRSGAYSRAASAAASAVGDHSAATSISTPCVVAG
jgi:hypothetical protein